jgi:hypothetical protein
MTVEVLDLAVLIIGVRAAFREQVEVVFKGSKCHLIYVDKAEQALTELQNAFIELVIIDPAALDTLPQNFSEQLRQIRGMEDVPLIHLIHCPFLMAKNGNPCPQCTLKPIIITGNSWWTCFLNLELLRAAYRKRRTKKARELRVETPNLIGSGKFQYDPDSRKAYVDRKPEPRITYLGYKLYTILIDHENKNIPKEELGNLVYPEKNFEKNRDGEALDKLIKRLRDNIDPHKNYIFAKNGGIFFRNPPRTEDE